jgi:hypothetical protein
MISLLFMLKPPRLRGGLSRQRYDDCSQSGSTEERLRERKWCLMRASDMQDMGLWRRNHLCDESESVRALFGQQSFPFQSCTRLRVFPSIRALAPFLDGSSDETVRFQRSSSPARVASQFSLRDMQRGSRERRGIPLVSGLLQNDLIQPFTRMIQ